MKTRMIAAVVAFGVLTGHLAFPAEPQSAAASGEAASPRPLAEGSEPEKLGQLGDPTLLVFEGNTTYTADQLRRGLSGSASFLLVSHPQAKLASFLPELEHKLTSGYLAGGFPSPSVTAAYDATLGRIRLKIIEGKRFNAGEVIVSGGPKRLQSEIRSRLTRYPEKPLTPFIRTATPGSTGAKSTSEVGGTTVTIEAGLRKGEESGKTTPAWATGEPANFDPSCATEIESVVQACLAEEGFLFPKIKVSRHPVPKGDTAELRIELEEGLPGTIVEINVVGNKRDTRAEVLRHVGLKYGLRVSRELFKSVERKLWDSARFVDWTITVEPVMAMEGKPEGVRLDLKLRELETAPRLAQRLSNNEQVMVRCANWLNEAAEDLELQIGTNRFGGRLLVSRQNGLLVEANLPDYGQALSVLLARDLFALCPNQGNYKFEIRDFRSLLEAFIKIEPASADTTNTWTMSIGCGARGTVGENTAASRGPTFRLHVSIPPAAMLKLVQDHPASIKNGVLTLAQSDRGSIKIDARTGRIQDLSASYDGLEVKLRFKPNLFKAARREFETRTAGLTNRLANRASLGSLLTFAGASVARGALIFANTNLALAQRETAARAAEKLLDNDVFAPLDSYIAAVEQDTFWVPQDALDLALAQNNLAAMFSGFVFKHCDAMFPKYSWPWTLARESVFILASHGTYTEAELQRLYESEDTGPVGSLVIALLLEKMGSPAARSFAVRGLTRLSAGDFQKDCELVLKAESGLAKSVAVVAANLAQLSDSEVASLAASLPEHEAVLLKECRAAVRSDAPGPLPSRLSPALERYWQNCLRAKVRSALQRVAYPPRTEPQRS